MLSKQLVGFGPISNLAARVLVLGSMPGERSLQASEYYAHPQNSFWKIMQRLIGLDPAWSYADRSAALKAAGIAVWDVLQKCERKGSLDTAIRGDTIVVNKFPSFFRRHTEIELVCFNGGFAEQSYHRHVLPTLRGRAIQYVRLPSTSPAHTLPFEKKVDAWKTALVAISDIHLQHRSSTSSPDN